jgi:hypothetical protein
MEEYRKKIEDREKREGKAPQDTQKQDGDENLVESKAEEPATEDYKTPGPSKSSVPRVQNPGPSPESEENYLDAPSARTPFQGYPSARSDQRLLNPASYGLTGPEPSASQGLYGRTLVDEVRQREAEQRRLENVEAGVRALTESMANLVSQLLDPSRNPPVQRSNPAGPPAHPGSQYETTHIPVPPSQWGNGNYPNVNTPPIPHPELVEPVRPPSPAHSVSTRSTMSNHDAAGHKIFVNQTLASLDKYNGAADTTKLILSSTKWISSTNGTFCRHIC